MDFSSGIADDATIRIAEAFARGHASDPASDAKLFVEFSVEPLLDDEATAKAGRPIYKDADFIRICRPGDNTDVVHRPVWMDPRHAYSDFHRFGKKYEAWKSGQSALASGTPLSALEAFGLLTRADVATYGHANIRTAEQFVGMADVDSQKFPGFSILKEKIQRFLDSAKAEAPAAELRKELADRDARIAAQDEAIKEMAATLAELKRSQSKKQ